MGLSSKSKKTLMRFYFDDLSVEEFNEWLWNADSIESELGSENYTKLIDYDLRTDDGSVGAKNLIQKIYDPVNDQEIYWDWVLFIAYGYLSNKNTADYLCQNLARLNLNGLAVIPDVFVGYASEADSLENLDFYRNRIEADVKALIGEIGRVKSIVLRKNPIRP